MDPRAQRRRPRSDSALRWWVSLNARPQTPTPPNRALAALLVLAALTVVASLPLVWHHLTVPNPAFYGPPTVEIIHGTDTATWVILVAVLAAGLAIGAYREAPTLGIRWTVTVLAFATVNSMFIDYIDWSLRGVSLYVQPYFGPGFYVALGGAALTVVAAIVAWRTAD